MKIRKKTKSYTKNTLYIWIYVFDVQFSYLALIDRKSFSTEFILVLLTINKRLLSPTPPLPRISQPRDGYDLSKQPSTLELQESFHSQYSLYLKNITKHDNQNLYVCQFPFPGSQPPIEPSHLTTVPNESAALELPVTSVAMPSMH
jgi:hypothetical protein